MSAPIDLWRYFLFICHLSVGLRLAEGALLSKIAVVAFKLSGSDSVLLFDSDSRTHVKQVLSGLLS